VVTPNFNLTELSYSVRSLLYAALAVYEDPGYRTGHHRGRRNVRSGKDPTGGSRPTQHSLSHNAVSRSPTPDQFILSLDRGETDPDPRIRFQLARDCWECEFDHAE